MTPDEAAAVLGVRPDASAHDIDHAFRARARELHPDRFVGGPEIEVHLANQRFAEVADARDVLIARAAAHRVEVVWDELEGETSAVPFGPPRSWRLIAVWTLLLAVGGVFASTGGWFVQPFDAWTRIVLLAVFAIATALTGKQWVWRATLLLVAVSAVATLWVTTVAALLGLGMTIIAVVGLGVQGRVVRLT